MIRCISRQRCFDEGKTDGRRNVVDHHPTIIIQKSYFVIMAAPNIFPKNGGFRPLGRSNMINVAGSVEWIPHGTSCLLH